MADLRQRRRVCRPSTRRLAQLYAALLYNAHLRGFIEGEIYTGNAKALCVPGLNCYSCPGAVGACPLGALQNALAASGHRAGWYVFGMLLLFAVALGRTICGWLCPMGLIQELIHKLPVRKLKKSRLTRWLSGVKYALLVVLVAAVPLYFGLARDLPLPAFCKYVCPAGTLEGAVALLAHPKNAALRSTLGALFAGKLSLLVAVIVACAFIYRAFCRFLCPLGAIYGLFNRFALIGVKVDATRCNGCGACARRCGMDVRLAGDRECIHCGACLEACPQGAIAFKCGSRTLHGLDRPAPGRPGRARRIVRAAALVLLAAALVIFNLPAGNAAPEASDPDAGYEVGQQLSDFTADLIGGGRFRLSDKRGHVVFINLWATYCTPCVGELPYFDRLKAEHPEVEVLAIHSSLVTDDVAAWLDDKGFSIDFAVDGDDDALFNAVGGSPLLPQTVVVDASGTVVYNQAGSLDYEKLEALLEAAR